MTVRKITINKHTITLAHMEIMQEIWVYVFIPNATLFIVSLRCGKSEPFSWKDAEKSSKDYITCKYQDGSLYVICVS